jgi:uncharacterized protein YndB with AHSA1/START domain/quercetin dioxygenase-like cupin family protein
MKPGDVLDVPQLGVRVEIRKTAAETGGELFEFDVVGRARGLIAQPHVHELQTERHEVIEGTMRLKIGKQEHLLRPGDSMEVPVGAAHSQRPGDGAGRVRVQLRPAGRTDAFLQRLADLDAGGRLNRLGFPKPVAAASLALDFGDEGHFAGAPLKAQQALARGILGLASSEYLFVDEWDVAAPREAVFAALADARSYPQWWTPVYIDVESSEGEPQLGKESRQHFKGRLPYHLNTRSRIVKLEPPHVVAGEVDGDLRGRGEWTLTETPAGTHVRFDWRVHADRRLLRLLTPLLRPLLRWNHDWAIARAREGLEPYARAQAAQRLSAPV